MKEKIKFSSIYFLGIGGIGMSALARYYAGAGISVAGYDKTATELTSMLESEGIPVHYTPDIKQIPEDIDLIIYTPAVPRDNEEFVVLEKSGIPMVKRSKAMAGLVNDKFCIAVAGTHGKTTISSLTTHILKTAGKEVLAFVGGLMKNYNKNIIFSQNPEFCVVEADEYDRSFLNLTPNIAVISAIDADHLDIYGDFDKLDQAFQQFASQVKNGGVIVAHQNVNIKNSEIPVSSYGIQCKHGLYAENVRFDNGEYFFDIYDQGEIVLKDVLFPFAGIHNVENALAAISATRLAGIKPEIIRKALADFKGIHRRFEFRINTKDLVYIDDYAHHPTEIDSLIKGVRGLYPHKKITGIFQPHLFSRTKDFAEDFARSLEKLDIIIVTDIYPARELPIPGIDAHFLMKKVIHQEKYFSILEDLPGLVRKLNPEILLTIGAGDIDKMVKPLEELLLTMKEEKL
jgi:UDP-N-acetylmuramate--alanine ligase